jgi:NitT/TauT family transport system substrate-binding protein
MKRMAWTAVLLMLLPRLADGAELHKVSIVIFGAPSLGAFLPPVIKAQKLDEKYGLSILFEERTPDAYTAQFNSGEFKVGGSAALLTVGLADVRGVKVAYLFNLFDYWGGVVTARPEIKSIKDIEGKDLAAAKGTTNYVMFDWFTRQLDVDPSRFAVVNTATPGLVGYAVADRASAVQLWEPAYTTLHAKAPAIRLLDLKIKESWNRFAGSTDIPYLGVAAHLDWIAQNKPLIPALYAAYKEAATWVTAHPEEAAALIAARGGAAERGSIADLVKVNERLGMNVRAAADLRPEIKAVYEAGKAVGFLPSDPAPATIYGEPLQ